jgi:hypothetical protein
MSKICDDISQTDQIRFWVSELTSLTPKQVDSVLESLEMKRVQQFERVVS